jgi:hypothetical protein
MQSYSFTDAAQRNGECYYRIQQMGVGGNYSYSPVVVIANCGEEPAEKLTIYPNPSFGVFNLPFNGDRKIDLTDRATGTHSVHFTVDGKTQIRKIVIER